MRAPSTDTTVSATPDTQSELVKLEKSDGTASGTISSLPSSEREQISMKTWTQQLSLTSGFDRDANLLKLIVRPLPMIAYPAVAFSFLAYAVSLAWVIAINITNPFILQAPPYSWKPSINGLINIAGLLGNLLGSWLGGWVGDRYSDWRSRRNGGVFQPETRLNLLVLPAIIVPAGCIVYGYGAAESLNWTALYVSKRFT